MRTMGYTPYLADPDVWMKLMRRESNNFKYYAYLLLWVDGCLVIHHTALNELYKLDKYFKMKDGSIGDPDMYLGAKLRKFTLENGVQTWGLSPSKYVHDAISNMENYPHQELDGRKLLKRAPTPFENEYTPELNVLSELDTKTATFYQTQVGVLRWIVKLGQINIITEASLLASQMALPKEGHLDVLVQIFLYLKGKHNSRMIFDPTYPEINYDEFLKHYWTNFYGEVKKVIPPNAPRTAGKDIDLQMFVDSDHAGDKATRRS